MTHESPARDAVFLIDLAGRISRNATPAMGFDQGDVDQLHRIATALTAAPQGIPEGFKLVPVEPTDEMLDVMHNRISILVDPAKQSAYIQNDREIWSIMLAAAPTPPAQSSEYTRGRAAGIEEAAQAAYVWWDGEPEDAEDLRIHLRALSAPTPVVEEWVK